MKLPEVSLMKFNNSLQRTRQYPYRISARVQLAIGIVLEARR
jgi:hypothetical protein